MKAVAFSNNDMAVAAWTFGGRIPGCLGFAVYRTDVKAGVETCLPALATFPNQDPTKNRTTADDPVQKFFWKDVYVKRGGSYRYRIVPMGGAPGALTPMAVGSLTTNIVQLTPDHGVLSAYFNRGILATQATARALHSAGDLVRMKTELLERIDDLKDPLRLDLAGDVIAAMTLLPNEALQQHGQLWCALYEFEDTQLIQSLEQVAGRAHVILSNMPGKVDDVKTNDTYAAERNAAKQAGLDITDRMIPSSHIGHNKFTVLDVARPSAVQFGSTNWTARALCAQSNNTIVAHSPLMAKAFKTYWDRLLAYGVDGDFVELGCKFVQSSVLISKIMQHHKANKKLYAYDSFEGFPPLTSVDGSAYHQDSSRQLKIYYDIIYAVQSTSIINTQRLVQRYIY